MTSGLLVVGQPGLQSEKTSLHEKHDGKPQHEKSKKKSKDSLSFAQDGFVLPQVRGAEGTSSWQATTMCVSSNHAVCWQP